LKIFRLRAKFLKCRMRSGCILHHNLQVPSLHLLIPLIRLVKVPECWRRSEELKHFFRLLLLVRMLILLPCCYSIMLPNNVRMVIPNVNMTVLPIITPSST
jgi:hypothetical protein